MNWFVTIGGIAYNLVIIAVCTAFIIYRRRKKSTNQEDFLFGGKRMGWFACAASIALTALGGGHINGLAYQSWHTGVATIFYCFGAGLCIVLQMRYVAVWYRRSGCNSVNELFGKMFDPALVPVLSGFGVGYCWLILCVETQGLATVISSMTGLSNLAGGIIGIIIAFFYVAIAGVEEVGLVNSVNAVLMYVFGFIALVAIGIYCGGGWEAINGNILQNNPELLHALGNPDIVRGYVIGTFLSLAFGMVYIQPNNQAAASVDDLRILRKAGIGAVIMNVMFGCIILSIGLASKGMFDMGLLPQMADLPAPAQNGATAIVFMIMFHLPNWLQICIIGMFLAAMLSTVSMVSLSIALMVNKDILKYFRRFENPTPAQENFRSRVLVAVSMATAAFAAVAIQEATNTTITWGFSWFIPLFFMFIIGMNWKRSKVAAWVTILACWIMNMILTFTPLASMLNLEGNNHSIFLCVISIVLGVIITACDAKAKPKFTSVYAKQRAKFDAEHGRSAVAR